MITGKHIAETAIHSGLIGTPYSKMDCQAFVEEILKRAGMRIPNYRGSNHMWRDLVYDRNPVKGTADIPAGALAFIVKNDGGEVKRGYHDDMGNATHVAIVIDSERVMESTTGGVQYGKLARFSSFGLIKDVDYAKGGISDAGERPSMSDEERIKTMIQILKDNLAELEDCVNDIYRGS